MNDITDGDHTGHRSTLGDRNVAEVLFHHKLHHVQDAVLGGHRNEVAGASHDLMNLSVCGLPAFHHNLGEVIWSEGIEIKEVKEGKKRSKTRAM